MESTDIHLGFLKKAGIASSLLTPLRGGANNRVYKVDHSPPLVLKAYFSHPGDPRPRLKSEFEFLEYAWQSGIRAIPQPIDRDPASNVALYSFLDGIPAGQAHSDRAFVEAAYQFLLDLNKSPKQAKHLGFASETCMQFNNYLTVVEKRLEKLAQEPFLHGFIHSRLLPKWNDCKAALHSSHFPDADPIISPSDFGLHNTIISSGKPCFIDFEYAGWEDPAKTICDFFLQPKIPVPFSEFESFSRAVASLTRSPSKTLERTRHLFPISKIKWCCIILNVFSKVGKSRREFAEHSQIFESQLQYAKKYLTDGPNL